MTTTTTKGETEAVYSWCDVKLLDPSRTNPRGPVVDAEVAGLAASVRLDGVLQPLVVRPRSGGRYEIVCGERRWCAAKLAGLTRVPTVVRVLSDAEAEAVQLVENLQREDLGPLEEATAMQALQARLGGTVTDLAARLGREVTTVRRRLSLLALIEPARALLRSGFLTVTHGYLLARLTERDQAAAIKANVEGEGKRRAFAPVSVLAGWIEREVYLDLARAPWDLTDASLVPEAGACLVCPKRAGTEPTLFPSLAVKAARVTCLDRVCYRGKERAWLVRARAAAALGGGVAVEKIVDISLHHRYSGEPPEVNAGLDPSAWRVLTKGCRAPEVGLVVREPDGYERHLAVIPDAKLGAAVKVCRDATCKQHRVGGGKGSPGQLDPAGRVTRRVEKLRAATDRRIAAALTQAIIARSRRGLSGPELHLVAARAYEEVWHETQPQVLTLLGFDPAQIKGAGGAEMLRVLQIGGPGLSWRMLRACTLARDLHDPRAATVLGFAKAARVDVGAITRTVRAEVAAEIKAVRARAAKAAAAARMEKGNRG